MISVHVKFHLFCDGAGCNAAESHAAEINTQNTKDEDLSRVLQDEILEFFTDKGWNIDEPDQDNINTIKVYCPVCSKKRE